MIWALASALAVAVGLLAAPSVASRLERRRRELPEVAPLCMSREPGRQARIELRIRRPASTSDWSIRRIEWLAPSGVGIGAVQDNRTFAPALETDLRPDGPHGHWFASDPTIWALYPREIAPPHRVRLRLTLERPGRRSRLVVAAIFPAMDWSEPPEPQSARATPTPPAAPQPAEVRSWAAREWSEENVVGFA
jgi:hypothetical protein